MSRPKKVVVIGGGIGGLTAAIYAAKCGFEALLYEQHTLVGGECTGWDRGGCHIDNCIHWMMGSRPGTTLYDIWKTTGAIGQGVAVHSADKMYTSELDGVQLSLWSDLNRTQQELLALSPQDAREIRRLIKFCRLAQKVQIPAKLPSELIGLGESLAMLFTMSPALKIFGQYKGMNVQDLMNRFHHPLIRCLISDFTPADSQACSFPMAYGNFTSGDGGIPAGGSRAMALRMQARLEQLGGRVFCGLAAASILVEEGRAAGILLADGQRIDCDYVVPACDTSVTFGKLLPDTYMDPLLREMYANRNAYPVYSTFQVALMADTDEDCIGGDHIWSCPPLVFAPGMHDRVTIKGYGYEPGFAPAGKQILQTLQGGSEEVYAFWQTLYQDKAAYKQKKQELAQQTLHETEKRFPAYRGKLTLLDAWTPMTYQRYCSAYKGFYQSFTIGKHSAKLPYPSAYVRGLDNVILAGQWLSPPGGLPGAAITGKFAIQRICKLEGMEYRRL